MTTATKIQKPLFAEGSRETGVVSVEAVGGPDCSHPAIRSTVHRRRGSERKQLRTISWNGSGMEAGTAGSSCVGLPVAAGADGSFCVSASDKSIPTDQTSPAGEVIMVAISGGS